jgi:hypothetical protein
MVWSNNLNGGDDSWDNMDDAGMIYFTDYEVYYLEEIILTGGDITVDGETLQIGIELISDNPPEPPTDRTLVWEVLEESTAQATISASGLVTPLTDGTFIVKAWSADEYAESEPITINISNQTLNVHEVSYIIDGYNDAPQEDGRPNAAWPTGDGYGTHTAWIEEGVFRFSSDSVLANPYSMKIRQATDLPLELKDSVWEASWVMWAVEETTFQLVCEDRGNGWGNQGVNVWSTENATSGGTARYDLTVTTEPTRFTIQYIPSNLNENSNEDFCFQPGKTGVDIFMDSLYLIPLHYKALIDWSWTTIENNKLSNATLNVYPNPASDMLNISLSGAGTTSRVAIYNSVGLKMEEMEVVGNHHAIDVSNYSSGLYFVKANNQVVKFVR